MEIKVNIDLNEMSDAEFYLTEIKYYGDSEYLTDAIFEKIKRVDMETLKLLYDYITGQEKDCIKLQNAINILVAIVKEIDENISDKDAFIVAVRIRY